MGSSAADAGKDVDTRIERATSKLTCDLRQAVEPKVELPDHFKRQYEPFMVKTLTTWRFRVSLLLSEIPYLEVQK